MNHCSLFSGIGGFDLASDWMGWNNLVQCEIYEFCRKVLKKYWPNTILYEDITKTDFSIHRGTIDVLSGGFPCQPFSTAGQRKGKSDSRYLWPEMLRAITEIKPKYVVCENVTGILSVENGKTIERILSEMENQGYKIEIYNIPACSVGAWHKRERIWIIAYTNNNTNRVKPKTDKKKNRVQGINREKIYTREFTRTNNEFNSNSVNKSSQRRDKETKKQPRPKERIRITSLYDYNDWQSLPKPTIYGRNHGVSYRMDRTKALGNAIVPQIAYEIFKVIEKIEEHE